MSGTHTRQLSTALGVFALVTAVGCANPPASSDTAAAPTSSAPDATMQLHHLHGLMAHGFDMALEGVSLKMLGQMKMATAVDAVSTSHGDSMMTEGRALIEEAVGGPAMTALHGTPAGSEGVMTYTHELGKAMTAVLDHFQQMAAVDPKDAKDMALHHMHVSLAHAAMMASQAAALKMTAAMKMAGPADHEADTHAAAMFVHARSLYDETMKGGAMTAAHAGAAAGDGMKGTHALGDSVGAVIDLLSKMP